MNSPQRPQTLKHYLAEKVEIQSKLGRTEDSIANEIGYERPHTLHMIIGGGMKLPLDKVLPLSRALNCEPAELFQLALRQYMSDLEVDELCGSFDANARSVVAHIRSVAGGKVPPLTPAQSDDLQRIFGSGGKTRTLDEMIDERDNELLRHLREELAFNGTLEFDLNVGLFGVTVQRKARVIWGEHAILGALRPQTRVPMGRPRGGSHAYGGFRCSRRRVVGVWR